MEGTTNNTTVPSIVVYVTVPNKEAGKKLAESIVKEKLAACVNRVPGKNFLLLISYIHSSARFYVAFENCCLKVLISGKSLVLVEIDKSIINMA